MNRLVEAHYKSNYRILVKRMSFRVGNYATHLAEEVVQEAYARALKYFNRFDPTLGDFDQWFSIILNNACNQCRNDERNKGVVYELDAAEDYFTVPLELVVSQDEMRFRNGLELAIDAENERDKTILTLFFFDGFKSREISEWLNLNHNTVRQVINRFREGLVNEPKGLV